MPCHGKALAVDSVSKYMCIKIHDYVNQNHRLIWSSIIRHKKPRLVKIKLNQFQEPLLGMSENIEYSELNIQC